MARSAKASITVSIGRNFGNAGSFVNAAGKTVPFTRSASPSAELLSEEIEEEMLQQFETRFIQQQGATLARGISARIDRELMRVGTAVARHAVGSTSGTDQNDTTSVTYDEEAPFLEWKNLARSTVGRKVANKRRFFMETGSLRQELKQKVGPGLKRLNQGGVKRGGKKSTTFNGVTVTMRPLPTHLPNKPRLQVADLRVELLPGVRVSSISQAAGVDNNEARSMVLERRLGLSKSARQKLLGPGAGFAKTRDGQSYHRPLIQPILQYYLQRRIPVAISTAINRAMNKTNAGGGYTENIR